MGRASARREGIGKPTERPADRGNPTMEWLAPRPGIAQISQHRHVSRAGADGRLVDLSMSTNALGPSPRAVAAYRQAAATIHRYPDANQSDLRRAIANRHGLDPARIVCSNGSDEMIRLVVQAYAGPGDEVILHRHAYRGFMQAVLAAGAVPVVAAERDLCVDVETMAELATDRTRVVLLANPNNPTGSYVSEDAVRRLRVELPPRALLVIDAAYGDYVQRQNYTAGIELVEDHDDVLMVRTFSKLHGLAGLRVGWAYGSATVAEAIDRIRPAYDVSLPAQAAAAAAVEDEGHAAATLAHTDVWRAWLTAEMASLGLRVYPSVCNFLLVRVPPDPNLGVGALTEHLDRRNIAVRTLADHGLPDCLRVTIGAEDENRALIGALAEVLA
jgi:histidinol-phosphate aminotransferase